MESAIYEGTIRHRRTAERHHEFTRRIALAYLDLSEVDSVVGGRLSRGGRGIVRFRRSDYLGDPEVSLDRSVRTLVADRIGKEPRGPIRLLTHLRAWGHCFNPASFYYCFQESGDRLAAIVAEVTNTPWGERHAYVLPCPEADTGLVHTGSFDKELHVSPFMGMDQRYVWRATEPGYSLFLQMQSIESGAPVFDATLKLRRSPLDRRNLRSITLRYPAATVNTVVGIYAHALVLKLKGVGVKPHPGATTP